MKKLFASKPAQPPERRHASPLGRTSAYAYYARRSAEQSTIGRRRFRDTISPQTAKQAASFWRQRFGVLAIVLVATISLVSVLDVSPDPKIVLIDGSTVGLLHSVSVYQQAAQEKFRSSILNGNKITINSNGISAGLKRKFPELSVVSVNLPLVGHRPIIYLAPTQSVLILATNSGRLYVIDVNGRAVGNATSASAADLDLVNVRDDSGAPVEVGQLALSSDTVGFIQTIVYQFQQKRISISAMVLPAGKSELDVYPIGVHYFVKFNLQSGTAQQQVGTYFAVRNSLQERGITPSQYVDVRLDGRAYYK